MSEKLYYSSPKDGRQKRRLGKKKFVPITLPSRQFFFHFFSWICQKYQRTVQQILKKNTSPNPRQLSEKSCHENIGKATNPFWTAGKCWGSHSFMDLEFIHTHTKKKINPGPPEGAPKFLEFHVHSESFRLILLEKKTYFPETVTADQIILWLNQKRNDF